MKWNVHEVNMKDYEKYNREEICEMINKNRKQHRIKMGEQWKVYGKEREAIEKEIHDLDIEEMILQTVLEEMDMNWGQY